MVPGETTSLVPSQVGMSAADEPRVICIICDMTATEGKNRLTLTLPASTKARTLIEEVANELGYVSDTFNLNYEMTADGEVSEVPLTQCTESMLGEICGNRGRNKFIVMDKDGVQPVKAEVQQSKDDSHVLLSSLSLGSSSYPVQESTSPQPSCSGNTSYTNSDHGYSFASSLIKSETGFVGLVNQAMTCYLNSLLQTLYMTPEFRNAIYRWEYDGREEERVRNIPYQLQRLFLQLQTSKRRAIETTDITKSFGWDSSESWQQHDVQELCRVMFDALEKKWKNTDQGDLINRLYQGKMKDYVKCLECGYESARKDSYLDVPLTLRPFGSQKAYDSVEEALHAFVSPEILDGNNQYFCEKCNKKCNAHKGLKFLTFPYLLTMQMKRFDFDYNTMHRIKLNDRMTFPEILNLNEMIDNCDEPMQIEKSKHLPNEVHQANHVNADKESIGEENDEGIDPGYSTSGTSVNSDSLSPSDAEAATNTRNAQDSKNTGPFVYELFSIMIHSGSAAGGHYYAYIKSFKDGLWYSFNDQHVTPITYDDIQKTYGGSPTNRGYYSSAFSSSTNAYMLMYRQIDKDRNKDFLTIENFPEHLSKALQQIRDVEEREKRQRELDRCTCKIKLFCFHPVHQKLCETRLEIHKDKTLKEATEVAWKLFELEEVVPLDCTRIVRYDEAYDWIERSYDLEDETTMSVLLGSVKSIYTFDLLLEVKRPDQSFVEYKPGGVTVKVFLVDLKCETINPPFTVRAYLTQTIAEFKGLIAQALEVQSENVRCVLEKYYNELKLLTVPNKSLKAEGFIRSNKVFVEVSGEEDEAAPFTQTLLYRLLDRYENTIRIQVGLPPFDPNEKVENGVSREVTPEKVSEDRDIDEGIAEVDSDTRINLETSETRKVSTDIKDTSVVDDENLPLLLNDHAEMKDVTDAVPSSSTQPEENWDEEENGIDDKNNDEEYRQYFTAAMQIDTQSGERLLTVCVDKRITLGAFKKELEPYVGLHADQFRMYRVYGNNQELETSRLTDTLSSFGDDNKINIKLGRALKKGEHRVKVYCLQLNDPEPCKYLFETIFCQGMTVLAAKKLLSEELQVQGTKKVSADRLRIRKKTWRNPGNIYLDTQTFDDNLHSLTNWEIFLEILPGSEPVKVSSQLSVYVRRWWPSKYQVDGLTEVVLDHHTVSELKDRISELSGIEVPNVEFAKGRGTFPCDMSALDIHKDLDWEPDVTTLNVWPLHIYEDGNVIYYRDRNEALAELSDEQKKELEQRESSRSSKLSTRVTYSPRKERALKIYTDDSPQPASKTRSVSSASLAKDAAPEFEPSTKISMTGGAQLADDLD